MTTGIGVSVRGVSVIIALAYLLFMFKSGDPPTHENFIRTEFAGVMDTPPTQVVAVQIIHAGQKHTVERHEGSWRDASSLSILGEPQVTMLEHAIMFMHTANPVRIMRPEEIASASGDPYGIENPAIVVRLSSLTGAVLDVKFGVRAPDGILQYMKVEGRAELYLMSGFVGEAWSKIATH